MLGLIRHFSLGPIRDIHARGVRGCNHARRIDPAADRATRGSRGFAGRGGAGRPPAGAASAVGDGAGTRVMARRSALRSRCRHAAIFWAGNTTICPSPPIALPVNRPRVATRWRDAWASGWRLAGPNFFGERVSGAEPNSQINSRASAGALGPSPRTTSPVSRSLESSADRL